MNTIMTNAFDGLLTPDFKEFDDSLEQYELTGEITTVTSNGWHEARETIQLGETSKAFNVRWRFLDPILSSVILRKTETLQNPMGRIDFNATVVSQREMQIQVGTNWYDLSTFVAQAIKVGSAVAANKSDEDILNTLRQYGFDPTARLPMYLQHLGAGEEAFALIAENFVERGAAENTNEVKGRAVGQKSHVMASFRHREGVGVASMEISKANRALSQTNSGFIGFLDASWGTLTKVLACHRQRIALDRILKDPSVVQEAKETAAARETDLRKVFTVPTSARAFRNWGGTTEVRDPLDDNSLPRYYAQQVPCGRFTIGGLGDQSTYSVWTTSRIMNAGTPSLSEMQDLQPLGELTPDASTF